jgi:hypothetical protein
MVYNKSSLFVGVILTSMMLSLSACGETEVNDVTNTNVASEKKEEEKVVEEKIFTVGETVSVDGVEITIDSVAFTEPTEYSEAVNGKIITLDVSIKNTNAEQAYVDNTEFSIYDSEGNKMDDYYGYDQMAMSDTVNSGKQLKGKLYFDVKEQEKYEMIYTPSFSMDNKEIIFDIAVK